MLIVMIMAIGIYLLWTTPILRFAADGVKDHMPTQTFAFIMRAIAWGSVCGIFTMGIRFAYQFKMPEFLVTMLIGVYFLLTGVGMKMGFSFSGAVAPYCLLPFVLLIKHFRPTIFNLQKRLNPAEPTAAASPPVAPD